MINTLVIRKNSSAFQRDTISMNPLSDEEMGVLHDALEDEYKAWATYDQVIHDFGQIRPFINIRDAEGRHIKALSRLFHRYALAVPPNTWINNVCRYESIQEACTAAVQSEIDNGDLYDRLIAASTRDDILTVLRNLQEASLERHLPAFQRCVARFAVTSSRLGLRAKGKPMCVLDTKMRTSTIGAPLLPLDAHHSSTSTRE